VLRDAVGTLAEQGTLGATLAGKASGYAFVYAIEMLLLVMTILVMRTLVSERTARVPSRTLTLSPK
jgi:BCD family chlorophyll transporter-like MFS transporter